MAPPVSQESVTPTWRIVVAFAVVLLLATALLLVSRTEASPRRPVASPVESAAATADPTTTSSGATTQPAPAADGLLLEHTQDALDAWGMFAATGDLDVVGATFGAGPQLDQLRTEAGNAAAEWPGLPAFQFAIVDSSVSRLTVEAAVVRASIEMTRPPDGAATALNWDIEMRWDDAAQRWRLYTVSTVDG